MDRQTDRQTEIAILKAAWSQLKIGHLFYATSSFVHLVIAICEFKLELQSGNAQFGLKSMIFLAVWPRNLTDDLKNHRASLLCYFKLCASFSSPMWIQTGVSPETAELGFDLCDLNLWPLTLTFCIDITSVIGNHSWKFHDDTMMVVNHPNQFE